MATHARHTSAWNGPVAVSAELWKESMSCSPPRTRPVEQRAGFLNRACGGDQKLRAKIEFLMRAATADKSFNRSVSCAKSCARYTWSMEPLVSERVLTARG